MVAETRRRECHSKRLSSAPCWAKKKFRSRLVAVHRSDKTALVVCLVKRAGVLDIYISRDQCCWAGNAGFQLRFHTRSVPSRDIHHCLKSPDPGSPCCGVPCLLEKRDLPQPHQFANDFSTTLQTTKKMVVGTP